MPNTRRYEDALKYVHLTGSATAITRDGRAVLERVIVNNSGSATLTVYDNDAASGDVVAVIDCSAEQGTYEFGLVLTTGLTVVLSAAADVTVVYQ